MGKYRFIALILISLNIFGMACLGGCTYYQKKQLMQHVIHVFDRCNNYSWKSYTGIEGMEYFSAELQQKLFVKDLDYNLQFIRNNKISSQCEIIEFREVKVRNDQAEVEFVMLLTTKDKEIEDSSLYHIALALSRGPIESWLIYEMVFQPIVESTT